jgi:ABC-type branched-subunit amino acid transport system ATPase component/branched-subunit amino acid ABC-type transport system permease component
VNDLLPFVVSGVALGAVYGLAATGLVLTYKTSGIFNFGYGAVATAAAYVFHWLHVDHGWDWVPAVLVAVALVGPLLGLGLQRFATALAPQPTPLKIVGTVGLILLVQGLASIRYGSTTIPVDQFLPRGEDSFRLGGVVVTYDKVILTLVAVVAVLALYAFFRWSRLGLAMRAVVDDPDLLAMHATDPQRVRRVAWVVGATFAALSGVLVAPLIGLDAILLTFLVVQAFAAAALGGFSSIPLTLAGGIAVGIAANVAKRYALDHQWLSGLPASLPFLVLFVVLLVRGRRLVAPTRVVRRPPLPYRAPGAVRVVAAVALAVPLIAVPWLVGDKLAFFTTGLVTAMMLLSLGLLVRMSGQVSLCHAAFAAIGAVAFSQLHVDHGLPWGVAFVLGGLVAVPVGALVAIPAIRLSGLFLALATFGFGILVQQLLYPQEWMFTHFSQGRAMPRPSFADNPQDLYHLVLALVGLTAAAVVLVQRSRLGRMLRGLADSPSGVAAMGLGTATVRVTAFGLSAFLAAEAGILLGVSRNYATAGDPFYGSFNSLILLAMLALAPFAEPWYAFFPAVAAVVPAYVGGDDTTHWINVVFGASAIGVAMAGGNPPMPVRLRALLDRARGRRVAGAGGGAPGPGPSPVPSASPERRSPGRAGGPGLEVAGLTVRFGGLVAVDRLTFRAPPGRITGLIGPNGAGKTCTFDAASGFNRRHAGTVRLHGHDVTRLPPAARARRGLGRTFQTAELCDTLTVADNVRLGHEAAHAGANPLTQLAAAPATWAASRSAADAAIDLCGLGELAGEQAGSLSTGQRRLVELARCLAGPFDILLLDEPSSGLDVDETDRFAAILTRVVAERGVGVLLVEHDMGLVMNLCRHLYVMDFGELIAEGPPDEIAASPSVRAAYLGTGAADGAGGVAGGSGDDVDPGLVAPAVAP